MTKVNWTSTNKKSWGYFNTAATKFRIDIYPAGNLVDKIAYVYAKAGTSWIRIAKQYVGSKEEVAMMIREAFQFGVEADERRAKL